MTQFSRKKIIAQKSSTDLTSTNSRITNLENNEYKVTYYEIISGASGSLTLPAGATINAGEFGLSGNCVLSKIDGSNKPTFESPKTAGGTVVTASLNETTGAWVASGVYTDANVALIYSIKIKAVYYSNLTYANIIETVDVGLAHLDSPTFTGTVTTPAIIVSSETASRVAIIDATSNVKSADTATYPSLTELSYGKGVTSAIQTQLNAKSGLLLYKINTPIAHTGTTSATVIHSYEITAGSLAANDFLKFSLRHAATNNANSKTIKLWANTSNTIAGATQLATYTYTTNSGGVFWFKRTMFFQNSLSSQKIINTTITHANDEVSYPNNGDPSLTLNFANSVWILIEVTLANAADTFTLNAYMNKIER